TSYPSAPARCGSISITSMKNCTCKTAPKPSTRSTARTPATAPNFRSIARRLLFLYVWKKKIMKPGIFFLLLLTPFSLFSQQQQQQTPPPKSQSSGGGIGFGIRGGFNFANVTNASQVNGSSMAGYHFALFLAPHSRGVIGSRTELIYSR